MSELLPTTQGKRIRGPRSAAGFHASSEGFDVSAAGTEQLEVVVLAPGRVLA